MYIYVCMHIRKVHLDIPKLKLYPRLAVSGLPRVAILQVVVEDLLELHLVPRWKGLKKQQWKESRAVVTRWEIYCKRIYWHKKLCIRPFCLAGRADCSSKQPRQVLETLAVPLGFVANWVPSGLLRYWQYYSYSAFSQCDWPSTLSKGHLLSASMPTPSCVDITLLGTQDKNVAWCGAFMNKGWFALLFEMR